MGCLNITQTKVNMDIGKHNVGENIYYTTTNNVRKIIDTYDKQKDLGVPFEPNL